jgi:hypothetical protein
MSTVGPFRAGLVQLCTGTDMARNAQAACGLVREARRLGADFVATPEMTNVIESRRDALLQKVTEEAADPVVAVLRELAGELAIHILIGSVALRSGDRLVNRSLLVTPDGAIAARYDKIHMFDVDLDGGESYRESRTYRPGERAVTADLPWGKLGLTVCYDVRFPALYRCLAQAGADVIDRALGLHPPDRCGPLARAAPGQGHRDRRVCAGAGARGKARKRARNLWPFAGGGAVGRGLGRDRRRCAGRRDLRHRSGGRGRGPAAGSRPRSRPAVQGAQASRRGWRHDPLRPRLRASSTNSKAGFATVLPATSSSRPERWNARCAAPCRSKSS